NNRSFEVDDDDYLTTAAPTPSHLWLVASEGGAPRRVTSGAWSLPVAHPPGPAPSPLSWSPDGKSIAITRRESPHEKTPDIAHVAIVDVATGSVRRLTDRAQDESQPLFSPDASVSRTGVMAFTGTTPSHPRELWVLASVDAKPRQLTHFNDWISGKELGRAERITWKFEGFDEDGVVIVPPGFDSSEKAPL